MPSKFVTERQLELRIANLNLRLASCVVYKEKLAQAQDLANVSSNYDLITQNLKQALNECQELLTSLEDPTLKKELFDFYTSSSINPKQTVAKAQNRGISHLKLKLQSYPCEIRKALSKDKYQGVVAIKSIEATTSANKFRATGLLTFSYDDFHHIESYSLDLTYNIKNPDYIVCMFNSKQGEQLHCKISLS